MLIFYVVGGDQTFIKPCVIIDALSSDDRFSTKEISENVKSLAPTGKIIGKTNIYSCEYSAEFTHKAIPLGEGIKTHFSGIIKSPPAELVSNFSPSYFLSLKSTADFSNPSGLFPNPQTNITYAAMVVKGFSGLITRQFIVYSAPIYPDQFGTTTTMELSGAMLSDIFKKSECGIEINKLTNLNTQLDLLLSKQKPPLKGKYNATQAKQKPETNILFPPITLSAVLDEICRQNKMVWNQEGQTITFNSSGPDGDPGKIGNSMSDFKPVAFSFLGSKGFLAWGLGVENYGNVKYKSSLFDPQLFGKVVLYNDIRSDFFKGLTANPGINVSRTSTPVLAYDMYVIQYSIIWNREESLCSVTATNNWLLSEFRIDGLLEASIYSDQLG
jgi:hypothetical protein